MSEKPKPIEWKTHRWAPADWYVLVKLVCEATIVIVSLFLLGYPLIGLL
jgi:hypothetical protein